MQFLGYDRKTRWLPLRPVDWTKGLGCCLVGWLVVLLSGCGGQAEFESNGTFRLRLEAETETDQQAGAEAVQELLAEWFGTPDQPRWPELGKSEAENEKPLLDPQRLVSAAGRQYSDRDDNHFGLYREHCNNCHGLTGNGRGPTAMFLSPYPRDFRPGWFKYKSTKRSAKPTKEDLLALIRHGIPGTSMPSFAVVEENDLEALVEYVIYLSVRGEVERELLYEAAHDPELLEGVHGRISDDSSDSVVRVIEVRSTLEAKASEIFRTVTSQWSDANESVVQVTVPEWFDDQAKVAAAVERGRVIFQGSIAACASCHGKTGAGNGLVRDYDEWTKDGTVRAGIEPTDRVALKKYLAAGGLKPVPISPRDLRSGIYRGGGKPEDLYRRIVQGIDGTPMPAVAMKPDNPQGLSEEEVWDLVAYVSAMPAEAKMDLAENQAEDLKAPTAVGALTSTVERQP